MKMSDHKKQAVYNAICESIMDLRVKANQEDRKLNPLDMDAELFKLETKIWLKLKTALNITGF